MQQPISRPMVLTVALFILSMFALSGCGGSAQSEQQVDAISVTGIVHRPDLQPLEAVEVYDAQGVLASSDADGNIAFSVDPQRATTLRLRKSGHTSQSVVLEVSDNKAYFDAVMGKRNPPVSFDAGQDADITDNSGARVALAAGALVDANGNPVTGNVQLEMTPVDVGDEDEALAFPGAFAGTDSNGNAAPLIMSYGTVEYRFTQNGEELNLSNNATASIEIPVFVTQHPDGSPIQAGDSGDLWYLDETSGEWILEDSATVVESVQSPTGLALRATVSHFSWWNHDIAPQTCELTITTNNLPAGASGKLDGVVGNGNSPYARTGSTAFTNSGKTVTMPRGQAVSLTANVTAPGGSAYTAQTTDTCDGAVDILTLEFEGPKPAVINHFSGGSVPVFSENSITGLWDHEGNDAVFAWSSYAAQSLVLTSDQGHQTTLGSDFGQTRFPLELNGMHAAQYNFTLTASSEAGEVFESVIIDYDESPAPVIKSVSYWNEESSDHQSQYLTLFWDTEGADWVDIGFLASGGAPGSETLLITDHDANTFGLDDVDVTPIPPDSDLIMIFRNQYGESYRQFPFNGCPDGAFVNDLGICEITVPL
jgi:hypothetical protein